MGRGTSPIGRGGSGGSRGSAPPAILQVDTKFTTREINQMTREQLENVARTVFIKQNVARGLTLEEADYRARSLMSGNSDAQLRKYIKRNG